MNTRYCLFAAGAILAALGLYAAGPADFVPDGTIKGSALTGWHKLGPAEWKVADGEVTSRPGPGGGWLVLDKSFQDIEFFANFRCTGTCSAGVMVRASKTPDGGLRGVYVSLNESDLAAYNLTLDASGKEISREKLKAPAPTGRGGGGGRGARGPSLHSGDWNEVLITAFGPAFRPTLNGLVVPNGVLDDSPSFGLVALYAGGTGEIRFKDVSWKDINTMTEPKEVTSSHFTSQRISDFYYGWGATTGDINRDSIPDIISGPYYYLGPDYTERRIYREGRIYNPATEYAPDMVNYAYDFNGDGWTDILSTEMRAMALYINPAGESRRWQRFMVLPEITTEIVLLRDMDGDGKPEIVYGGATGYAWARPEPASPTAKWPIHHISSAASNIHGLGAGDINGDGRLDVVTPAGWYEQPPEGIARENWTFHEFDFAITAPAGVLPGGGMMGVYDVNGDGRSDVVSSLAAHDWGLAWFEQKRSADGAISFVKHVIARDFSTKNAGGVVFSEPHASAYGDIDGDGVPDFIVGKSLWHHLENYNGPDPYGPAVLYVYRTVRNPKAEGGAKFVPEMVHNRSGVGSAIGLADLNKDERLIS